MMRAAEPSISIETLELVNEIRQHPVFICGHPKAGTSLLRAVLDSHPQLLVYPEETVFFRRFLPKMKDTSKEEQLRLADQDLIQIFNWNLAGEHPSQAGFPDRDYSSIPFDAVHLAMVQLHNVQHSHPGDILSAAVLAFGLVAGAVTSELRYWVEKSPYNEYYSENIFSWWPEARCIHILRDPRENFASYRRKHPDWSAEFFAANWSRSTRAGIQNQKAFGSHRYYFVRYEDLAQAPEQHLKKLAEFLKITWDPSLSTPTRAGKQWGGNSMFEDQFQEISAIPVSRAKDNLSPAETEVITRMTKSLLDTWNYPYSPSRQFFIRLVGQIRSLTWPLRRPIYHLQKSTRKTV